MHLTWRSALPISSGTRIVQQLLMGPVDTACYCEQGPLSTATRTAGIAQAHAQRGEQRGQGSYSLMSIGIADILMSVL